MSHPSGAPQCPHWRRPSAGHLPGGCSCIVDATATHERVQTLVAMGWSLRDQGRELGSRQPHSFAVILRRQRITRRTALQVAAMFDRLWNTPGPSPRSVTRAIHLGWPSIDPEVVERLVIGKQVPHSNIERDIAIRIVARNAEEFPTPNAIAVHVGTSIPIVRRVLSDAA